MFELTMLGAIVATVITPVVTAGFGHGNGKLQRADQDPSQPILRASRARPYDHIW